MDGFALVFAAIAFVIAIVAQSQARRANGDVAALRKRLGAVELELRHLREAPPEPAPEPQPEPEPELIAPVEAPPPPPPAAAPARPAVEQALTERWLVWLGGVALALGGAFLVKMSVEMGLLGPAVRVTLGTFGGAGLMALGHVLRRRAAVGDLAWQVPPVLVGAGAAMLFASLFAAHGLYGLIGPLPTFAALAAVAAATALLALAHGPYVALLGLAGAFAVPALVHSPDPDAVGLFAYLLVVSAGGLALLRWRAWWWLAWAVLAAAAGWTVLWMFDAWQRGDELVLGAYLLALAGLFAGFRLGLPWVAALALPAEAPMVPRVVTAAAMVVAVLLGLLVNVADHSQVALALPFLFALGCMAFGRKDAMFDRLPWLAALLMAAAIGSWGDVAAGPLAWVAGGGAVLFGGGGFALLKKSRRRWRWAALAAGATVLLLAVSYARLPGALAGWGWTALALALAAVQVAAAARVARRRHWLGMEAALAALAVGAVASLALAATMALEEAWLTVALSLMLPGIAWVHWHLSITGLRRVAVVVAGAVLVRLALNPDILDYAGTAWLVYGYCAPALAFWAAARRFARSRVDVTVAVLDAGGILFATLFVSLEIHAWATGGLAMTRLPALAETSLHTIAWAAGAAVLFVVHRKGGGAVSLWAGRILLALATATAVLVQALADNPLHSGAEVGTGAVVNLLLLAYLAPAALFAVHGRLAPPAPAWQRPACAALAVAFAFLWLSLEVRHAFAGPRLDLAPVAQAEMWAYSAAWLLGGLALLGGGLLRRSVPWRRAGLAVVLVVVAKVFILDLSQLTGLWRAVSFLGLGAVLVGIGGLYRRFART